MNRAGPAAPPERTTKPLPAEYVMPVGPPATEIVKACFCPLAA